MSPKLTPDQVLLLLVEELELTDEQVYGLLGSRNLLKDMLRLPNLSSMNRRALQGILEQSFDAPCGPSLSAQVAKYFEWNARYGLKLDVQALQAIDLTPTPGLRPGEVERIAYYLPDQNGICGAQRTYDLFRRIAALEAGKLFSDGEEHFWEVRGAQRRCVEAQAHLPGLRRVILDRWAYHRPTDGRTELEVQQWARRDGVVLAGAEVLMDAALDPHAARIMDGDEHPYQVMGAYRAEFPGGKPWGLVPYLAWDSDYRSAQLDCCADDQLMRDCASPTVRTP